MPQQSQSLSGILPPGAPIAGTLRQAEILIADLERMNYDATQYKSALSSLVDAGRNSQTPEDVMRVAGSIEGVLGELQYLARTTLSDKEPKEEAIETQMAASIEQLLSDADSRNILLQPALVANAANAFAKGDNKTLLSLSKSIETMLADNIKAQIAEDKIPTRLDDDSVVLIGKTTRTRYDPTGAPIPSGNNNTELFSRFAEQAFTPTREAMAGIPVIGSVITTQVDGSPLIPATQAGQIDVGARPEAYASMERPALSSIEQKEEARKRVRDLYLSGDKDGALDLLNSAGGKGLFGGDYTIDELDVMYDNEASPEKEKERPPLRDIIPTKK